MFVHEDLILLLYYNYINTFASQSLVFEGKTRQFFLENASNLTHEFLYDNFNKKIQQNYLVKIDAFSKRND